MELDDQHHTTSVDIFHLAAFFTLEFLILYMVYLLQVMKGIWLDKGHITKYLPLFGWATLVIYMLNPIFNCKNRWFIIRSTLKALVSPLCGVVVRDVMIVAQWISLITPLRDLSYTFCYYTVLDLEAEITEKN